MVHIMRLALTVTSLSLAMSFSSPTFSTDSPKFTANFAVHVMGLDIGTSSQSLSCQAAQCTLTNRAVPSAWARHLVNEETHEVIKLTLDENHQFRWLEYHKTLQKYRNTPDPKITHYFWDQETDVISYPARARTWPAQPHAFDMISIVYALRQQLRAGNPRPELLLQDNKTQTPVKFAKANDSTQIHTRFRSNLAARYYEWASPEATVKVWFLEDYDLFPGKIELTHQQSNRRVSLNLISAPTF